MEEKLKKFISDQIDALKLLYSKKLLMPFLMVFYATIDTLGYISDKNDEKEINKRFQAFVEKYMSAKLPGIDSVDVWVQDVAFFINLAQHLIIVKKAKLKSFFIRGNWQNMI